ncbi:synaptophysin-like protein 1 isoform X2 [Catharus ustulatus]|uniref:synaptophysin-like protein 1 isoform X1 n=1 Tax=Catharus ustulatus TaxID=91951 RepID=UPI00140E1D33|nr:synaptophysin-like protein 1 isoform X1 [Catharus ustulatus]XP_032940397.1 synaptophysin-like protein 1 isoform X2 [Catharus ustulatus]
MAAPRFSLGPLKEPLGLIRALQWFFSIFAFATCGGFEGSVTFRVTCEGRENHTVSAHFGYPFRLHQAVFQPSLTHLCNHTWPKDVHLIGDFSSAARFFVAVGVASFLYSLGALGGYLGYLHLYRCAGSRLPLMDPRTWCSRAWWPPCGSWPARPGPRPWDTSGRPRPRPSPTAPPPPRCAPTAGPRPWGGWGPPWPSDSSTWCSGPAAPGSSTRRPRCTARPRPPTPPPPPCDPSPHPSWRILPLFFLGRIWGRG